MDLKTFFTTKTAFALIVVGVLLAGLVGGVYLSQRQTQLKSKAAACTVGQVCTCSGISAGACDQCNGGWCNGGQCSTCGVDTAQPASNPVGTASCKTTTICGQAATGGKPEDCKLTCSNGKAIYHCVQGEPNPNPYCVSDISCAPDDSKCTTTTPPQAPTAPGVGGPTSTCPSTALENISNEALIAKCTLAEIALLPNDRLQTFSMSILTQLPNSRLEQFSLDFLAKFPNERLEQLSLGVLEKFPNQRLQQFTIPFLQKFSNNRLITMDVSVLKQFPEERIKTFPCEVQIQLGYSCGDTVALSGTACYILSETQADVTAVTNCDDTSAKAKGIVHTYSSDPSTVNYTIVNKTPGVKNIYVRFISKKGEVADGFGQITLAPDPVVSAVACTQSATGTGTVVALAGTNFGAHTQQGVGAITVNGTQAQIVTWDVSNPARNLIQATVPTRLEGALNIDLKIDDGRTFTGGKCTIGTSSVQFSVNTQCTQPTNFSADNVDAIIIQNVAGAKPLVQTKVNISKGQPTNFAPKLEANKSYSLILKAPRTLAKKINFTTDQGTVNLGVSSLIIGDIAPFSAPDGVINSLDNSEMIRQWSLISSGAANKTASLIEHETPGIVNSLDYSCLKLGNGKQNEVDIKSVSQ